MKKRNIKKEKNIVRIKDVVIGKGMSLKKLKERMEKDIVKIVRVEDERKGKKENERKSG